MNLPLPPDPYKILNVPIDAQLPTIRSAHRKLVLKCHPDKVQDAAEKLLKQDEFQKVQEAYELLSDDRRRTQYDDTVKLIRKRDELREEMGRPPGQPTVFEFEIRNAEPGRTTTTTYTTNGRPKQSKASPVYPHPRSASFDDMYEEPSRTVPRKTASYETERKRTTTTTTTTRESERERKAAEEDKRRYERREQEKRSSKESKKSRDKDRRRGTEEKVHRTYVEDDSDDYRDHPRVEKKASSSATRKIMEEHIRAAEEAARVQERAQREAIIAQEKAEQARAEAARAQEKIRPTQLPEKYEQSFSYATQYLQASRTTADKESFTPPPQIRRADTYTGTSYVRYETAKPAYTPTSDDDTPRRSSARTTRRSAETPSKSRDVPKANGSSRRSPTARGESYIKIVEPSSPPSLQKQTSEPPSSSRRAPSRSKTEQYPSREEKIPSMSRAATFTQGVVQGVYQTVERSSEERDRGRGSRLKQEYYSGESDSERPIIIPSQTRSPVREHTTHYKVADGRATKHRVDIREVEPEYLNESPLSRPPLRTTQSARPAPTRSSPTQGYYPAPEVPDTIAVPIIQNVQPKPRGSSRTRGRGPYFGEIQYAHSFRPEDITYSNVQYTDKLPYTTPERRGSETRRVAEYPTSTYTTRPRAEAIYT